MQFQFLSAMAVKFLLAFLFSTLVIERSYAHIAIKATAECPHSTFVAKHVSRNNIEPREPVAAVEAAEKKTE